MGLRKAWDKIMEKINSPTIFEFDIEKFYDKVHWSRCTTELWNIGIPRKMTQSIMFSLIHSQLEQGEQRQVEEAERIIKTPTLTECIKAMGIIAGSIEFIGRKITKKLDMEDLEKRKKYVTYHRFPNGLYIIEKTPGFERSQVRGDIQERGLPQGLTISGFTACTTLNKVYEEFKEKLIMYIDDGLLMGNINTLDLIRFSGWLQTSAGVTISPKKSGYVKRNGIWIKPLKFLGLEYHGKTGKIKASTRRGATMDLPDLSKLIEKLEAMGYHSINGDKMTNWWIANKLQLTDFLLAYIFNKGRLNPKDCEKNKREHPESFLQQMMRLRNDMNRTNASSKMVKVLQRMHEKGRFLGISAKNKSELTHILKEIASQDDQPLSQGDHDSAGRQKSI